MPGVTSVISGYTGGTVAKPTYQQVGMGGTGHAEAVEVHYDPSKVTYQQLLATFWHDTDPLDARGQFCDKGDEYRSEIFYHDDEQKRLAEASKAALEQAHRFGSQTIVTKIAPAGPFYPAEDYHQGYAKKNPVRYNFYRWNCGRDQRLTELWGEDADGRQGRELRAAEAVARPSAQAGTTRMGDARPFVSVGRASRSRPFPLRCHPGLGPGFRVAGLGQTRA